MNALDFLFDFAALMSTSSALTSPPGTIPDYVPVQEGQPSKVLSAPITAPTSGQGQRPLMPSVETYSMPPDGDQLSALSRAQAEFLNQHPIDWTPTASVLRDGFFLQQDFALPAESARPPPSQFPGVDFDAMCGQQQDENRYCACMPPLLHCLPQGCTPPMAWDQQQFHAEQEPHHQLLLTEGVGYGFDCASLAQEQLCACQDFPTHGYCVGDRYMPVDPHSIDFDNSLPEFAIHSDSMGVFGQYQHASL